MTRQAHSHKDFPINRLGCLRRIRYQSLMMNDHEYKRKVPTPAWTVGDRILQTVVYCASGPWPAFFWLSIAALGSVALNPVTCIDLKQNRHRFESFPSYDTCMIILPRNRPGFYLCIATPAWMLLFSRRSGRHWSLASIRRHDFSRETKCAISLSILDQRMRRCCGKGRHGCLPKVPPVPSSRYARCLPCKRSESEPRMG